jgi:hypothetical protein
MNARSSARPSISAIPRGSPPFEQDRKLSLGDHHRCNVDLFRRSARLKLHVVSRYQLREHEHHLSDRKEPAGARGRPMSAKLAQSNTRGEQLTKRAFHDRRCGTRVLSWSSNMPMRKRRRPRSLWSLRNGIHRRRPGFRRSWGPVG